MPLVCSIGADVRQMALEAIEEPAWFYQTGINEDGGISLYHRLPGRLPKRIANKGNSIFISATLSVAGSFKNFQGSMGIDAISSLSSIIEPEHHGTIELHTPLDEEPAEVIHRATKPCLVVTPSFELAETIGKQIPNATVRLQTETTTEAAKRIGADGVLIAAGAWAGLDTPTVWVSIVVPKIPLTRQVGQSVTYSISVKK
jgi:Rad3-related DNA helicase